MRVGPARRVVFALQRLITMSSKCVSFDAKAFESKLSTKRLGKPIVYMASVGSTMTEASRLASASKPCGTGTLVVSDEQTEGVGRNKRVWRSPPRENIYASMVLRPSRADELVRINFAAPLAIAMAAEKEGVKARVKWPNDVWVGSRKLAGVLLNASAVASTSNPITATLGMGINVNQPMAEVKNLGDQPGLNGAISMRDAVGRVVSREAFLANICANLEDLLGKSTEALMVAYTKYDILLGNEVTVMPNKREDTSAFYTATAVDFTDAGYLRVRRGAQGSGAGELVTLVAEEVSVRPATNQTRA